MQSTENVLDYILDYLILLWDIYYCSVIKLTTLNGVGGGFYLHGCGILLRAFNYLILLHIAIHWYPPENIHVAAECAKERKHLGLIIAICVPYTVLFPR